MLGASILICFQIDFHFFVLKEFIWSLERPLFYILYVTNSAFSLGQEKGLFRKKSWAGSLGHLRDLCSIDCMLLTVPFPGGRKRTFGKKSVNWIHFVSYYQLKDWPLFRIHFVSYYQLKDWILFKIFFVSYYQLKLAFSVVTTVLGCLHLVVAGKMLFGRANISHLLLAVSRSGLRKQTRVVGRGF